MKGYEVIKSFCVVVLTTVICFFFVSLTEKIDEFNATTQVALRGIVLDADRATQSLVNTSNQLNATSTDLRRTIQIAGGTLNIVRDTMRDEQKSIKASIVSSQALIDNSSQLAKTGSDTLAKIAQSVNESVAPLPSLLKQTEYNLSLLEDSEQELTPLLKNTSDTMNHLSGITSDVQHEVHQFVFPPPQPWYKKYILHPIEIGIHMITIPLN